MHNGKYNFSFVPLFGVSTIRGSLRVPMTMLCGICVCTCIGEQDLAAHAYDNAAEAARKCEDKQLLAQIMNGQKRLKMH